MAFAVVAASLGGGTATPVVMVVAAILFTVSVFVPPQKAPA